MTLSVLKSLYISLFNIKEKIYHRVSQDEIELIKQTNLFHNLTYQQFDEMLRSASLVKYPPESIILREGETGDSIYIILAGSVRVFTHHMPEKKIYLARLNKGDYFGEQAFLGQANKSRSANIEAIDLTTLIKIDESFINSVLQKDKHLKVKLQKLGCEQALNVLSLPSELYHEMRSIISRIDNPHIIDLAKGEIIFHAYDNPDYVYFVLKGAVEIILPKEKKFKTNLLLVHKGHIFGELGIIFDKPRAATAIAHQETRLLAIEGNFFKTQLAQKPRLREILSILQKTYLIPRTGTVEQYIGNVHDMGVAITSIYKLENGKSIVSAQFVNQNLFTMAFVDTPVQRFYPYKDATKQIELGIYKKKLVGIKVFGTWDNLPNACHYLLKNVPIDSDKLIQFEHTGELILEKQTENIPKIICPCMSVTKKQIQDCISKGIKTLDGIIMQTGACTVCRGCEPTILEMLGEAPWLSAMLKKFASYNKNINGYLLKPTQSEFKPFKPGQYVIIQAKVENDWIERPYSISGINTHGDILIIIKKHGYFTRWLFEKVNDDLPIKVTQPRGSFIFDLASNKETVCFAYGIGITPFITFAKILAEKESNTRLHILYSAVTKNEFILVDEFDALIKLTPTLTITYHSIDIAGALSVADVIKVVKSFHEPDIYVCGSVHFIDFIQRSLKAIEYDANKIHIEQFFHAGSPE